MFIHFISIGKQDFKSEQGIEPEQALSRQKRSVQFMQRSVYTL